MLKRRRLIELGLAFDDVLLVPKRTRAVSRKLVDVSSWLTKKIHLSLPVVSANVPWCTEAAMAIAMAKLGGIGFIHRVNRPEEQARQVREVKGHEFNKADYPGASLDSLGRLLVGAAVGVKRDWEERAQLLIEASVDLLVLDVAHGHADYVVETLEKLKRNFPAIEVIAGNVATREGAADLISAGADALKVGIGPGGVCTTRIVTGCGVPQITALLNCCEEAAEHGIPVIADGGIRTSGDLVKALAAGASTVMLGSLLAGTEESAAKTIDMEGEKCKVSTGFASMGMELSLKRLEEGTVNKEELEQYVPEGVEATFNYAGNVSRVLTQLIGGLRSGLSYCGSMSISELHEKAEFVRISSFGLNESMPHIINKSVSISPDIKELSTSSN